MQWPHFSSGSVCIRLLYLLLWLCCAHTAHARTDMYNLSLKDGLPTNHVYRTLVDKYGYLWIATDNGLVRYNGYSLKVFDANNGISNPDIWELFEDRKGRVWVMNISDEMGYIKQDRYHKVHFDKPLHIYANRMIEHREGVAFITRNSRETAYLCIEKNDSIYSYRLRRGTNNVWADNYQLHSSRLFVYIPDQKGVYAINYSPSRGVSLQKMFTISNLVERIDGDYVHTKRLAGDTVMRNWDVRTGKWTTTSIEKDEDYIFTLYYKNRYYNTTNKNFYLYDNALRSVDKISFQQLQETQQDDNILFISVIEDTLWGRCFSTTNKGLYITLPQSRFKKSTGSAEDRFVGNIGDSVYYLWNQGARILTTVNARGQRIKTHHTELNYLRSIIPSNEPGVVLIMDQEVFKYKQDGSLTPYYPHHYKYTRLLSDSLVYKGNVSMAVGLAYESNMLRGILDSLNRIHAVNVYYSTTVTWASNDTLYSQYLDDNRYKGIVYHPHSKFYLMYGADRVLIHRDSFLQKIGSEMFPHFGIRRINEILLDKASGYIFIRADNKLLVYDVNSNKMVSLFDDYNLTGASILLDRGRIFAVGRFGVVYSHILPGMRFANAGASFNLKGAYYNTVDAAYIIHDTLFINTDMGQYAMDIRYRQGYDKYYHVRPDYRLLVSSSLMYDTVGTGDTILLEQDKPDLQLDFINRYGRGRVAYDYTIEEAARSEHNLSGQVSIYGLQAGRYYTMRLVVSDDVWKSRPYILHMYVRPYWSQTVAGKRWIIFFIILGLLVISALAVLGTRHILLRKHEKQSRYMELELKSIYAQLNPHFIFNTLSSIVYYIRKNKNKEAYKYLNAFAKLLRSYIESSRNKWVTIDEEVENLKNYILLQRSRFDDRFDYTLHIDEHLDSSSTMIPSLLLQPIVENAIQHGLQQKENGHLHVSFVQGDDPAVLVITIDDDGIGRMKAKAQQKASSHNVKSYGSDIIKDLTAIFERYELLKIDIQYIDKELPHTGTTVILTIKYHS